MCSAKFSPSLQDGKTAEPLLPLVVILGPTAAGKTEVSIQLGEYFNGEIVSADSRLFYRGMDIGTAKPSLEERTRVPHHLIDVTNPDNPWSLGIFQGEANLAIKEILGRNRLPFMVGGTGQFIHAIIEDWRIPTVEPNPRLREVLAEWGKNIGPTELHTKLARLDPQAARVIEPSNVRRTIRALEVIFSTGRRFSELRSVGNKQYNSLLLGLSCPRIELYQRIDKRISKMIEDGLVEEVKRLLDLGYSPELPTLSAIGYGEIIMYLRGKATLPEAIHLMKRQTRIYVRRQANWFRENDTRIHWYQNEPFVVEKMKETIEKWLLTSGWEKNLLISQ